MLPLYTDFVTPNAIIAAMNAWVLDKSKSLSETLDAQSDTGEIVERESCER